MGLRKLIIGKRYVSLKDQAVQSAIAHYKGKVINLKSQSRYMQTVRYARHSICKTHGIGARLKGDWNVCGGQYYSSVFNSGPDLCKTRRKIHA